ncbi:MAG: serine/threonine-protein kinase [Isosphaeraceae bacterium]
MTREARGAGRGCPGEETWRGYLDQTSGDADSLDAHLDDCPACRDRLDALGLSATDVASPAGRVPVPPVALPGYEFVRPLGLGGAGTVYLARQTATDRHVAVKLVSTLGRADPMREARAAVWARHAGVVEVHDAGELPGVAFLVMELATRGSLDDLLDEAGPLPPRTAARLLAGVSRGVAALHGVGQIHRDIKPRNILLFGAPEDPPEALRAKVSDFGLARPVGETAGGATVGAGTPGYMAPEQAYKPSHRLGPPADVYSLGAVLYTLLTGRAPSSGLDPEETPRRPIDAGPLPLRRLCPGLDRDLDTIVRTCLDPDPARRYRTAAELADDFDRYLEGEPIAARPMGVAERLWRWSRRRPAVAALSAACAALLLAFLVVTGTLFVRAEAARRETEDLLRETSHSLETLANLAHDPSGPSVARQRRELSLVLDQVRALHRRRPDLAETRGSLVEVLARLADLDQTVGDSASAIDLLKEAVSLCEPDFTHGLGDRTARRRLARHLHNLAESYVLTSNWAAAEAACLRACATYEPLVNINIWDPPRLDFGHYQYQFARILLQSGRGPEGQAVADAELTHLARFAALHPGDDELSRLINRWLDTDLDHSNHSDLVRRSLESNEDSLRYLQRTVDPLFGRAMAEPDVAKRRTIYAELDSLIRSRIGKIEQIAQDDPRNFGELAVIARVCQILGVANEQLGRPHESELAFRKAIRYADLAIGLKGSLQDVLYFYNDMMVGLAESMSDQGAPFDGVLRELREQFDHLVKSTNRPDVWRPRFVRILTQFSMRCRTRGHTAQSATLLDLAGRELEALKHQPVDRLVLNAVAAEYWVQVGKQHWKDPDHTRAREAFRKAVEAAREIGDREVLDDRLRRLARFLTDIGEFRDAFERHRERESLWPESPERRRLMTEVYRDLAEDIRKRHSPLPSDLKSLVEECQTHAARLEGVAMERAR